ncbi:MAG TPA: zinc ribbon domain-containing protein [Gemmatimonadales bacterium]|nr:zinc ribbon domain-containing protein [Gemmatimonadales bacterium]
MPIFDFACQACGHEFEALVRGDAAVTCPSCKRGELTRLPSLPSVRTSGTRAKSLESAKRRDASQARERMHEQLHYERSHDRHG